MIVRAEDGGVEVVEADDLQRLHVEAGRGVESLGPLGRFADGGEHAWLSVEALRGAGDGGDPDWQRGFDAMIAYAGSKGWLSDDGAEVRAHVERT